MIDAAWKIGLNGEQAQHLFTHRNPSRLYMMLTKAILLTSQNALYGAIAAELIDTEIGYKPEDWTRALAEGLMVGVDLIHNPPKPAESNAGYL